MIFSFHIGLTDSVMQWMQLFVSVSVCSTFCYHRSARFIILIFVSKKVNESKFENFVLCERILINVTTCQNETSS
jgi:hypothetical protein